MKHYTLAQDDDRHSFICECNRLLSEGWTAIGGVSVIKRLELDFYTQAFVK